MLSFIKLIKFKNYADGLITEMDKAISSDDISNLNKLPDIREWLKLTNIIPENQTNIGVEDLRRFRALVERIQKKYEIWKSQEQE